MKSYLVYFLPTVKYKDSKFTEVFTLIWTPSFSTDSWPLISDNGRRLDVDLWSVEMELCSLLDAGRAYVGTVGTH